MKIATLLLDIFNGVLMVINIIMKPLSFLAFLAFAVFFLIIHPIAIIPLVAFCWYVRK